MSTTPERAELERRLKEVGESETLSVAETALWLAALDTPEADYAGGLAHLAEIADGAREVLAGFDAASAAEELATAMGGLLSGRYRYLGDADTYEDLRNANLLSVIERRRGLPVALGILYLHAARAAGVELRGLNFPGHFVLRLEAGGGAAILDPFNGGALMTAADLRNLLKRSVGPEADLIRDVYRPVSDLDVLLRLENNILGRAIGQGDFARARAVLTRMIWLAPKRANLRLELGRLEVHAGCLTAANDAFLDCKLVAEQTGEQELADLAANALKRLRGYLH